MTATRDPGADHELLGEHGAQHIAGLRGVFALHSPSVDKRHLIALLAAAAFVAVALSACKKTRSTCTDPPENSRRDIELDDDEKRMAEAALRDPTFCQELASPRIALANDELVLSGPTERRSTSYGALRRRDPQCRLALSESPVLRLAAHEDQADEPRKAGD